MRGSIRKTMFCLILMMFFILSSIETVIGENVETEKQAREEEKINIKYVPGEVIVGFHSCIPPNADVLIAQHGGTIIKTDDTLHFVLIKTDDTDRFIENIKVYQSIEYAEHNVYGYVTYSPNDPLFSNPHNQSLPDSKQWGPQKIGAPQAWDVGTGSSTITIAIIDTGIDYNHRDLMKNLWYNVDEIPHDKLDNDGNGYVDDYIGWNFIYDNPDSQYYPYRPTDPMDDNAHGHGSHVSGIAAATIDNSIGIAGIVQAQLMALKISDSTGAGAVADAAEAIEYAADNGANIISMSFQFPDTSTLENACNYAWSKGCLLVASSGNDNSNIIAFPAQYDSVIAVGATNRNDQRCNPTDWGTGNGSHYGSELELVAPGDEIVSTCTHRTKEPQFHNAGGFYHDGDRYIVLSGTSMATPHVSGVAALVWSRNPYLTNQQVREILKDTADDLVYTRGSEVATSGWDQYTGYGRVNVSEAAGDEVSPAVSSFLINNGDDYTNHRDVSLGVSASDTGLGVYQMRFSNSNSPYWHNKYREIESPHGCEWTGKLYVLDPFDPAGVILDDVSQPENVTESDHPYTSTGDTYTWHIQSYDPDDIRMRIGFSKIVLAKGLVKSDVLEVWDSNNNLIRRWSGDSFENSWTDCFSGRSAMIKLKTYGFGSAWGFYAETYYYETASGSNYPNDYGKAWHINGNDRTKIHFEYIDTDLDVDDYVRIYDSVGSSADAVYSGYHQDVWTQELYGDVKIEFLSDSSITDKGFRIDYYKKYVGYPRNYDNWWVIREPGALEMRVHFTKIETCSGDNIHIYDKNNTHIESYSGNYSDLWTSAVSGDTIKIRFVANNDYNTAWGFKIDEHQYWDYSWSAWEPYNTIEDPWTLTSGDGEKTVYCQVEDYAGNVAGVHPNLVSDTIILDTIADPPTVSSSTHPDQDKWYSHNDPRFDWTPPSDLSGIEGYYYILDQNSNTIPTPSTGTWTTDTSKTFYDVEDGAWYFHIVSKDNAGNVGTTADHYGVLIDVTPPTNSLILINNDEEYTNSTHVTLKLSASDTHSNVSHMRFSNGVFHDLPYSLDSPGSWGADNHKVVESDHPYANNCYETWEISHPGATKMRVHFTMVDTTEGDPPPDPAIPDVLYVKDKNDVTVNRYRWYDRENFWSDTVDGDKIILILDGGDSSGDLKKSGWGFKTDKYQIWADHIYPNNYDYTWVKTHSGALKMKVHFTEIDTQANHDFIYIYDKYNNQIAHYSGHHIDIWTPAVDGETIKIRLVTDSSVKGWGFNIDKYSYYSYPGTWTDWEPYQTTKEWNLPSGDGKKAVYFQTKDAAGNIAPYVYDTIILDTVPPNAVHMYNITSVTSSTMDVEWSESTDDDFQKYDLHYATNEGFVPSDATLYNSSTDKQWTYETVKNLSSSTTYYFKVRVFDVANSYADSNEVNNTTASSGGSCPYVYVWNGTDYVEDNAILPKSKDSAREERDIIDYYQLEETTVPKDGEYSLVIKELEKEHTNLDQLQLMTIDHGSNVHVAVTQNGTVLTYGDPIEPLSVEDRYMRDYLVTLSTIGGEYYEGVKDDYLVIDFGNPNTTNGAKLVLRWDRAPYYKCYGLPSSIPSSLGPIKIQIYTPEYIWKDIASIVPRDKWAVDIVDLSPYLQEMSNESFKVRLWWHAYHKVDYVGLDTTQQVDANVQTHSISSAVHSILGDITNKLLYKDGDHVKMGEGEQINVTFPYIPEDNETRDVVLISKGYYYYIIGDADVSQNVKVTMQVDGTVGNTVEMRLLETSVLRGYLSAPITTTPLTVGQSGNTVNTSFGAYSNRNYCIWLRYISNNGGINPVTIELEYNDHLKTKNVTFDSSEGIIQEKFVMIDSDLHEVLCETLDGIVMANCGTILNFEPGNLMEDNDIFGWENIEWSFGDGIILSTTDRIVTHEYEVPGIYTMMVTVTYEDGAVVTKTKEIWVS